MLLPANSHNRWFNAGYSAQMLPGAQLNVPHAAMHVIRDLAQFQTLDHTSHIYIILWTTIHCLPQLRSYSRPYATACARPPALAISCSIWCAAPQSASSNTCLCRAFVTSLPLYAHYQHSNTARRAGSHFFVRWCVPPWTICSKDAYDGIPGAPLSWWCHQTALRRWQPSLVLHQMLQSLHRPSTTGC